MLRAIASYLSNEVLPRWYEIVTSVQFWLALVLGGLFGALGTHVSVGSAKVGDVLTAVLAYAAIAFGFSVTGLTVAFTLPDQRFTAMLATAEFDRSRRSRLYQRFVKREPNAYSDLFFVFSWTALLHWALLAWGFGTLIASGADSSLLGPKPSTLARIDSAGLAALLVYALLQFLVVLVTISQVGRVYIIQLRKSSRGSADT